MGMAATQARYLMLTAKQSNLEYQGQLINQERSDLSAQTTELYNSLVDLQVPTPPSTNDYTKIVYSGSTGTTTFNIGNVIPEGGTYTVDLEYRKVGNYVSEANTVSVREVTSQIKAEVVDLSTKYTPQILENNGTVSGNVADNTEVAAGYTYDSALYSATDIYQLDSDNNLVKLSDEEKAALAEGKSDGDALTGYYAIVPAENPVVNTIGATEQTTLSSDDTQVTTANGYYVKDSATPAAGDTILLNGEVIASATTEQAAEPSAVKLRAYNSATDLTALTSGTLDLIQSTGTKNYNDGDILVGNESQAEKYEGGYSQQQIIDGKYYVQSGDDVVVVNSENFADYFEEGAIVNGTQTYKLSDPSTKMYKKSTAANADTIKNPDYDGSHNYYIAGQLCYNFQEALRDGKISDSNMDNYVEALYNTYTELFTECDTNTEKRDKAMNEFKVYFTTNAAGGLVPHFIKGSDLTSTGGDVNGTKYVSSLDYTPNGTYTSVKRTAGCILTFDASGRITSIKIPDDNGEQYSTSSLEANKVTDDAAYNDAYEKYKYKQYEYDKMQAEINTKMKIIQEEDRTLELRLQRLDTERQQITTEMDALDKVIKDNIEKSYKTFSG